ncbi:DUF1634 domain-containing protein [bacterium]|nr:DUF1634 domain-containing protein [bacterium]
MTEKKDNLEYILSWVLLIGVATSAFLLLVGLLLLHLHPQPHPQNIFSLFQGHFHLNGYSLLALGLLLLLATPIMRVLFSLILFAKMRDFTYVFLTFIVLIVLIISIILGGLMKRSFGP